MDYSMKKPCDNCPFRSDKPFPLAEGRVEEILGGGSFPCHKTTTEGGTDGKNQKACAGLMILLEKEGQPNQMMRISERLGFYDHTKLDMDAPIYDNIDDCIEGIEWADEQRSIQNDR